MIRKLQPEKELSFLCQLFKRSIGSVFSITFFFAHIHASCSSPSAFPAPPLKLCGIRSHQHCLLFLPNIFLYMAWIYTNCLIGSFAYVRQTNIWNFIQLWCLPVMCSEFNSGTELKTFLFMWLTDLGPCSACLLLTIKFKAKLQSQKSKIVYQNWPVNLKGKQLGT